MTAVCQSEHAIYETTELNSIGMNAIWDAVTEALQQPWHSSWQPDENIVIQC